MIETVECPDCEEGTIWKSRRGGNDPDVWPTTCPTCEGCGTVEVDLNDEADE